MSNDATKDILSLYCSGLRQAAHDGTDWLVSNASWIPQNVEGQIREMRKRCVEARRLERAAHRKMCVGVFGPSQAGKSYLISALARKGTKPLMANFGGRLINFLDDINPQGGKESTGLVTRFTLDRPANAPPGTMAELRLLTEQDVVKVLANSYTHDIDHSDEDEDQHNLQAIEDALARLETLAQQRPTSKLDAVDVVDLEAYCESRLRKAPRIKVLQRTNFWKVATRIAPYLALPERVELFSLIWDGIDAFTNVYRRMNQALSQVDFATTLYVKFEDSLQDRARSIITVDTLSGVGEGKGDLIPVVTADGKASNILRAELAAITAELRIVMEDKPFDFFDHTDLLDFPGYRSRGGVAKKDLAKYLAENGMREFMIRGKVAYLFERYSDEQELTSVLLCHGPENFEVVDLLPTIYDWIGSSNGAQPAHRSAERTSLFFIMTKYDRIFEQSSGKAEDASRFHARLDNNLLHSFGKQAYENGPRSWVHEWLPGTPFNNVFLLRNPAIIQDSLFEYVNGAEIGLRADKRDYVDNLRRVFVNDGTIRQYHDRPDEAWDAMMNLNDGGARRIAERLRPVCNPETKRQQVIRKAGELRSQLQAHLQPFFYSGDVAEQRRKKRQLLQRLAPQLKKCLDSDRFAELLRVLQVEASDLYGVYEIVERRPVVSEDNGAAPQAAADADVLDNLLGLASADPKPATNKTGSDMPTRFAMGVEGYWNERLAGLTNDSQLLQYFFMTREDMVGLTQELVYGAKRSGLGDRLIEVTKAGAAFRNVPKSSLIWKQAKPAAQAINDFVAMLGFGGRLRPSGSEIEIDARKFQVFVPPPPVGEEPTLKEERTRYDAAYFTDWLRALLRLSEDNVEFEAGIKINIQANEQLGGYLVALAKPVPVTG